MFKRVFTMFCFCLFAASASASASGGDILYLKNGDQLTGTIKSYNSSALEIGTGYGRLTIPLADIGGLAAGNAITQNNVQTALSDLQTQGTPPPQAAPTPVIEAAPQTPAAQAEPMLWGAKWSGNANIGADLKTGNSETSGITADSTIKARWDKHRALAKLDYNREKDNGNTTVDNRSLALGHDYFFSEKWFWGNKATFKQDEIDKLDLRTILTSGLGYQAFEQDDLNLKFVLGPGFINEDFEDGTSDQSATINWGLDYDQKFYDGFFALFHNHDLTAPADDTNAYLFQSESGIRIPIRDGIVASGQVDFDWDNEPVLGTVEDDTIYAVKLGYEW